MKSYIMLVVVILVCFGYMASGVMNVADNINKRVEIINSTLQGK